MADAGAASVVLPEPLDLAATWDSPADLRSPDRRADASACHPPRRGRLLVEARPERDTVTPMIRRYSGDKKSIEARTADNGKTWTVKFFDTGRLTQYSGGSLAELDALAAKNQLKLDK